MTTLLILKQFSSPAFLQVYSSMCSHPEVKTWTNININTDLLNTEYLEKALTCLKEKVNKELEIVHEISKHYGGEFIHEPAFSIHSEW